MALTAWYVTARCPSVCHTIRYDTRCYFDVRSKADMSQIILQHGTTTVETRKTAKWKRICSEVSVNSPGNPWSQSGKRKRRLRWKRFAEKESPIVCPSMVAGNCKAGGRSTALSSKCGQCHDYNQGTRLDADLLKASKEAAVMSIYTALLFLFRSFGMLISHVQCVFTLVDSTCPCIYTSWLHTVANKLISR